MKNIVYRYRINKFKRFTNGMIFAIISIIALLCIGDISNYPTSRIDVLLPFTISIISILLGFVTMFHQGNVPKGNITMNK